MSSSKIQCKYCTAPIRVEFSDNFIDWKRILERSSFQPYRNLYIVCSVARSPVLVGGEGKY